MARWHSCNILQIASDANRLWQFDAKGGSFALNRELRAALDEPLPSRLITKSWSSLWQPQLNVAWLPLEPRAPPPAGGAVSVQIDHKIMELIVAATVERRLAAAGKCLSARH